MDEVGPYRATWLAAPSYRRRPPRGDAPGHLAGAGLDVTDPEPLPEDHGLRSLPHVLISPHNAGRTSESQTEALARMRENVRLVLSGSPPIDPVG